MEATLQRHTYKIIRTAPPIFLLVTLPVLSLLRVGAANTTKQEASSSTGHEGLSNPLGLAGPPDVCGVSAFYS